MGCGRCGARSWAALALLLALACSQPAHAVTGTRRFGQEAGSAQQQAAVVAAGELAAAPAQEAVQPLRRQPSIVPLPSALGQLPPVPTAAGAAAASSSGATDTDGTAAGGVVQPRVAAAPAPEAAAAESLLARAAAPAAEAAAPSAQQAAGAPAQEAAAESTPPLRGTAHPGYWAPLSTEQLPNFACGLGGSSPYFQVRSCPAAQTW